MSTADDMRAAAEQAASDAKQLRRQADLAEANQLWDQGDRSAALAFLHAAGHDNLADYCRSKGLRGDEIPEAIQAANIDFR